MDNFEGYITYDEYKELSGKVPEDAFPKVLRKAQRFLDSVTFDRVKHLTRVPSVVKEVLAEFIDMQYAKDSVTSSASSVASEYSNGIESIVFTENSEDRFRANLVKVAVEWLPDYLTARSVNFDVEQYLQSEGNNS